MNTSIDTLVSQIESQLERLGWLCSDEQPCACCVEPEQNLPLGWVRVYDDYTSTYGPADKILAALAAATVADIELNAAGLSAFADSAPDNSQDWPEDLYDSEQIEEGTPNDEPLTLFSVKTNGGTKYTCGPNGVFTCALSEALRYDSFSDSREAAIAEAQAEAEAEEAAE